MFSTSLMSRVTVFRIVIALFASGLMAPWFNVAAAPRGDFSEADDAIIRDRWPEAIETPSGLRYVILEEGDGEKPRSHQRVRVLYKGSLLDGKVFSQALDEATAFRFTVGMDHVILGWEEAILDMRVGEKRLIIVPYALGYGLRGRPPEIPNRATLVFELELLSIE